MAREHAEWDEPDTADTKPERIEGTISGTAPARTAGNGRVEPGALRAGR